MVSVACHGSVLDSQILGQLSAPVFVVDVKGTQVPNAPLSNKHTTGKDVLLVVDISGSMGGTEPQLIKAILEVGKALNSRDRLSVITFNTRANLLFPLQFLPSTIHLQNVISGIKANGGTSILSGLKQALQHLLNVCYKEVEQKGKRARSPEPKKKFNKWDDEEEEYDTSDTTDYSQKQYVVKKGEEGRLAAILLLSDGQDGSARNLSSIQGLIDRFYERQVLFHSFGFTVNHDHDVLQRVTTIGNCGSGLYYTFEKDTDIAPAVGDCLGAASTICANNVVLSAIAVHEGKEFPCSFYLGSDVDSEDKDGHLSAKLGALPPDSKHSLIVICQQEFNSPAKLKIVSKYTNPATSEEVEDITWCPFPQENTDPITLTHVKTHYLRLRVGASLVKLIDPAGSRIIPDLEALHTVLLSEIVQAQTLENATSLSDENILIALEQDLGEALEKLNKSHEGIMNRNLRGKFLQYAHEHLHQRSASTGSRVRGTYSTKEQVAMRLRFLAATDKNFKDKAVVAAEKAVVPVDAPGVTAEQSEKRKQADELLTCYVTLGTWREEEMGIGLLVKPRTMRERYKKLMPMVSIVPDYISATAFNAGVKATAQQQDAALDRDNDDEEDHSMVKSSSRGRINAWLPLYINKSHWESAKTYAASALSIIATQYNDMFQPIYALKVCSKLMIANVVKFTVEDQHASSKAIQMYCDIHRFFLQMSKEYPDVLKTADEELKRFIEIPSNRSRAKTPDLGDLILYLTITPNYSWEDLKRSYILESFRRSARFVRATAGHVPLASISDYEALFDYWMRGTNGGKVTMFNILFLNMIARPEGKTLDDIIDMYDSRWGQLPDDKFNALKKGYNEVMKVTQLPEVLTKLGLPMEKEALAELILWAFENKIEDGKVEWEDIPTEGGRRWQEWQESVELFKLVDSVPTPTIPPYITYKRPIHYDGLANFLSSMTLDGASTVHSQECYCERCEFSRKRSERVGNWRLQFTEEGDPTGQYEKKKPAATRPNQLFVGGLPKMGDKDEIRAEIIQEFGDGANSVELILDKKTGKMKGYAFVELAPFLLPSDVAKSHAAFKVKGKDVIVDVVKGGVDPSFVPTYLRR